MKLSSDEIYPILVSILKDVTSTNTAHSAFFPHPKTELAYLITQLEQEATQESFLERLISFFCLELSTLHPSSTITPHYLMDIAKEIATHHTGSLCFSTSGSTGNPKQHIYSLDVCYEEVFAAQKHLPHFARVVSIMPVHHIFGFIFTVLLPSVAKVPVLRFSPTAVADLFNSLQSEDLVVAFPFFWKNFCDLADKTASHHTPSNQVFLGESYPVELHHSGPQLAQPQLTQNLHALSSTSPCPPSIPQRLTTPTLGSGIFATFTEIYGSTETSAVGIRRYPSQNYTLLDNWAVIHGESPEAESLIYRCLPKAKSITAKPLPDNATWPTPDSFYPTGRLDKAVQVGGKNVYPQTITKILKTHPSIYDCVVRLMRPEEGVRLKAFIVPIDDTPETLAHLSSTALRKWCVSRLNAPSTPRVITIGATLPRNAMGKLTDW